MRFFYFWIYVYHDLRATVITIINGLFGSSSFIFLIFKWLYEGGMTLKMIFTIYTITSILWLRFKSLKFFTQTEFLENSLIDIFTTFLCFFRTFLFTPRRIYPFDIPSDYKFGILGKRFIIIILINSSLLIKYYRDQPRWRSLMLLTLASGLSPIILNSLSTKAHFIEKQNKFLRSGTLS